MSRSWKTMLGYPRFTMLAAVILTLASCGGSSETGEEQGRTGGASSGSGTSEATTTDKMESAGMEGGMGGMAVPNDVPRLPPVKAYYEGEEVFFVHPEASDRETADLLTDMMGSPVVVVPEL